jgi:hypothetical protein
MFHHLNSPKAESTNLATLLDKLASQPNGLENANKLLERLHRQSEPQLTPEAAKRNRLIAIAMRLGEVLFRTIIRA